MTNRLDHFAINHINLRYIDLAQRSNKYPILNKFQPKGAKS